VEDQELNRQGRRFTRNSAWHFFEKADGNVDPGHGYQREDEARARKQHYDAVAVVVGQAGGPLSTTLARAVRQVKKSVAGFCRSLTANQESTIQVIAEYSAGSFAAVFSRD